VVVNDIKDFIVMLKIEVVIFFFFFFFKQEGIPILIEKSSHNKIEIVSTHGHLKHTITTLSDNENFKYLGI